MKRFIYLFYIGFVICILQCCAQTETLKSNIPKSNGKDSSYIMELTKEEATKNTPEIKNLPASFYNREGLQNMPIVNYESMYVVNVKNFGAKGDGNANDKDAFSSAVLHILNNEDSIKNGGIIFIPKGIYTFYDTDETYAYWNLNPDIIANKNPGREDFKKTLNIHFVGEGEDSIIRFMYKGIDQGNMFDSSTAKYVGWYLGGCENVSLRDMSMTIFGTADHRYFYNPARTVSSGSDTYPSKNIQYINVNIDQGAIGIQSQALVEDVWVVDSKVRNTTADGIAFYGVIGGNALYNYVENSGDDAYALWADSLPKNQGRDYLVMNNIAHEVRFGRGILMKGINALVKNNWIEKCVAAGIISTNANNSINDELFAVNNIVIRTNMSGRPDNLAITNKNNGGIYAWGDFVSLNYINNKIYGSGLDGISIGSATIDKLTIEGNLISSNERYGINFDRRSHMEQVDIRNNTILGNRTDDINIIGRVVKKSFESNLTERDTSIAGFKKVDEITQYDEAIQYRDIYESFRFEHVPSEWGLVPSIETDENLTVINVKDYGAVGDGKKDDREAFVKAINKLPKEGGILKIPAGNYVIGKGEGIEHSMPFTIIRHHLLIEDKSNIHIIGDGEKSSLVFTDPDMQGLRLVNVSNSTIKNIKLKLSNQPLLRHNRALLDITASRMIEINGVYADNSSGIGIYIDTCTGVVIKDSIISNSGQYGIRLSADVSAYVFNNKIINTRDHGIFVSHFGGISREPNRIRIYSNTVDGSKEGTGIAIANGINIEVEKNIIKNTYMAGINIFQPTVAYPTRSLIIKENILDRCNFGSNTYTGGAITMLMGSVTDSNVYSYCEFRIHDNKITNTPKDGIYIGRYAARLLDIQGNIFSKIQGKEVEVSQLAVIKELVINKE